MSTTSAICDIINSVLDQKRERALYNVPLLRLTPVSPYPTYTQIQLNMRRKIEILKYTSNNQNSKQNNLTKAQLWTLLVNGSTQNMSQAQISNHDPTTTPCPNDDTIPTLTTASDVPGPPIILQFDPTVPLYKYLGDQNRTYGITPNRDFSKWRLFTKNEVDFVEAKLGRTTFTADASSNNHSFREFTGVILITDYINVPTYTFNFSTPVAVWISGVQHTLFDYYALAHFYDPSGSPPVDIDYLDRTFLTAIANNKFVNLHITNVTVEIYYNQTLVTTNVPTINYNFQDISFNISALSHEFYAIQFVGMLYVNNLTLPTQAGYIYDVKINFTYTYDHSVINVLRVFQTGVFTNLNVANQNVQVSCSLNSGAPSGYSSGDFIQYSTTFPVP